MGRAGRTIKRTVALALCISVLLSGEAVTSYANSREVNGSMQKNSLSFKNVSDNEIPETEVIEVNPVNDVSEEDTYADEPVFADDSVISSDNCPSENIFSGRIVDEFGAPIEGVSVFVWNYDEETKVGWYKTDEAGIWSSDELIVGNRYRITYYHRDYDFDKYIFDRVCGADESVVEDVSANSNEYAWVDVSSDDFEFETISDVEIRITKYTGSDIVVYLPSRINGLTVKEIGTKILDGTTGVETVIFPDTVEKICSSAFEGYSSLKNVRFNAGIKKIDNKAFFKCVGISEISIPNTIEKIGVSAFRELTNLKEVYIPDSVDSVDQYAFRDCTQLEKVNYPLNVSQTDCDNNYSYASTGERGSIFAGCTKLTGIVVGEGVKRIVKYFFANSKAITDIHLPESLQEIEVGAFSGCTGLTEINIPGNVQLISERVFYRCTSLSDVIMQEGLGYIGASAFEGCSSLTEVYVPNSVTDIGYFAFKDCSSLVKINYPLNLQNSVAGKPADYEYYKGAVFENCSKLKTVEIPNGVTKIAPYFFGKASSVVYIEFPVSLEEIGAYAFYGCTGLSEICFPSAVTTIGRYAFSGCSRLKKVVASNVTTIDTAAFNGCGELELFEHNEDKLQTLRDNAFKGCTKLSSIRFTENLTAIGNTVFAGCENMICYAPQYSYAYIELVKQNVNVVPSNDTRYPIWSDKLDVNNCSYRTTFSSNAQDGTLAFSLDYALKQEVFSTGSNRNINILIPKGTSITQESIKFDGEIATNFSIKGQFLVIPIKKATGRITFNAKRTSADTAIVSYATFTCKNGTTITNIIDVISENVTVLSLETPSATSTGEVKVNGYAAPEQEVFLFVNGIPAKSVICNKVGFYEDSVTIAGPINGRSYTIAAALDELGENEFVSKRVIYNIQYPVLNCFKMKYAGREYNLLSDKIGNISHHPLDKFYFEIGFENGEWIENVYVVATKANKKKRIEAIWDENLGKYTVVDGYFETNNILNPPGNFSVEFSLKRQEPTEIAEIEEYVQQVYEDNSSLFNSIEYEKKTVENDSDAPIGLENPTSEIVTIEFPSQDPSDDETVIITGHSRGGGLIENIGKLTGAPVNNGPGFDFAVDTRNPYKPVVYIQENGSLVLDAYYFSGKSQDVLKEVGKYYGQEGLKKIFGEELGNLLNILSLGEFLNGLDESEDGYDELRWDIMTSDMTAAEKEEALRLAEDYYVMKTLMSFMLFAAGLVPGFGVGLVLSIAVVSAIMDIFYDIYEEFLRTGTVPYELRWLIDPSGYVFDSETGARLLNVKTSIYCILPDGEATEDFWNNPPNEEETGVLWDAENYSQQNPMYTDDEGCYGWDVLEGWWKVTYECEGYEPTSSSWMPVPPPQLDVNIGMTPVSSRIVNGEYSYDYVMPKVFTGSKICPKIDLECNGVKLVEKVDYTLSYKNNINVGTGTIIVTGKGNYTEKIKINFEILPKSLGNGDPFSDEYKVTVANKQKTGKELKSKPSITLGKYILSDSTDYAISYSGDLVNPGIVTVTVTAREGGNFTGSATCTYNIYAKGKNISDYYVSSKKSVVYSGEDVSLNDYNITVKATKKSKTALIRDVDYEVRFAKNSNRSNVGNVKLDIVGIGAFCGTKTITVSVAPKKLSTSDVSINLEGDNVYTGGSIKPSATVCLSSSLPEEENGLILGKDYTVKYSNNVNAASENEKSSKGKDIAPKATITFKGNFSGEVERTFAIAPQILTQSDVNVKVDDYGVTSYSDAISAKNLNTTVKYGTKTLVRNKDYKVSFEKVGGEISQSATIVFIGNYTGEAAGNFALYLRKETISLANIAVSGNEFVYTGKNITPEIKVYSENGYELTKGRDYTVTYSNNLNACSKSSKNAPKWTVKGIGAYKGTVSVKFSILPKEITNDFFTAETADMLYTGKTLKPKVVIKDTEIGKTLKEGKDYTVKSKTKEICEDAEIIFTGKGNYKNASDPEKALKAYMRIYKKSLSSLKVVIATQTYTGQQLTPDVKIYMDKNKTKEFASENYTIQYGTNIKAGLGYVYITAMPGTEYGGTRKVSFAILPKWLKWITTE